MEVKVPRRLAKSITTLQILQMFAGVFVNLIHSAAKGMRNLQKKTCITITCIPTLVRGWLCGVIILFRNTNINKLYTRMPDFLSVSVSGSSCDRDTQSLILSSLMYGSYLVLFLQYFKTTYSENIQITVMEHEKAQ
jgi:hypothetical protein